MIEIFQVPDNTQYPVRQFAEFNYIKKTYLETIANIEKYYHDRVYAVRSNHLLCNLLRTLDAPSSYSGEQFLRTVDSRIDYVARIFGISSVTNKGKILNGIFYGNGTNEILVVNNTKFSTDFVENNWRIISSVKTVLHPKSDMNLLLPNGKKTSESGGYAVIMINIALLAYQYKCYLTDFANQNEVRDVSYFIHMYVLPNMVLEQTDITIFNRLKNRFYGLPNEVSDTKHSFRITHYEDKLDAVLDDVLNNLEMHSYLYPAVLKNIPALAHSNMLSSLRIPDTAISRQIYWATILSRLNVCRFIIELSGMRALSNNRHYINRLLRDIKMTNLETIYKEILPEELLNSVLEDIAVIKSFV